VSVTCFRAALFDDFAGGVSSLKHDLEELPWRCGHEIIFEEMRFDQLAEMRCGDRALGDILAIVLLSARRRKSPMNPVRGELRVPALRNRFEKIRRGCGLRLARPHRRERKSVVLYEARPFLVRLVREAPFSVF